MYVAASFHKSAFLWRVFDIEYECEANIALLHLRLKWFKRSWEWKVTLAKDGYNNATIKFYREIDGKREAWGVQGPIFRIY